MISENPLDRKVFQDELDFKTLENILETLDHVTPKKISRQEYNNLKGNFLVELPGDKFGKSYDLFLPDDLVYGELLHLIDFLSRKFGIENYTPYDRILTQTKIMVGVILRGGNSEEELRSLAEKYNISDEFIKRILGQNLKFSDSKEIIKSIKGKRIQNNNEKVGNNKEDVALGFEELKDLFGEEFDLTFFYIKAKKSNNFEALVNALEKVGFDYGKDGNPQKELDLYNKALHIIKSPKIFSRRASVYARLGKYKKALDDIDNAINISPEDYNLHGLKGYYLMEMKNFIEAIKPLERAIEINPSSDYYGWLGSCYLYILDYQKANNIFDKILTKNSKDSIGYSGKRRLFELLGKNKLKKLYYFTTNLLNDGKSSFIEILYRKEKAKIKQLIDSQDFEGLRLYLLELEQEEN